MTRFLKSGPSFAEARWVLFGAPCDTTVSRKGGTRYAPDAVRSESHHIESYSPYLSEDLEKVSFFDMGDLFFAPGDVRGSLLKIEKMSSSLANKGKRILMLGENIWLVWARSEDCFRGSRLARPSLRRSCGSTGLLPREQI